MKGLVLKDIINLKKQYKFILAIFTFYLILSLAGDNSAMFGGIIALMMVMLTITAMAFDERSNWDKYALTMPVTRSQVVLSKYLLGAILSAAALVLNFVFQLLIGPGSVQEAALISLSLFGVGFLFLSLVLPLLFKFGVEKGRLAMMMALFLPTGIILIASKAGLDLPNLEAMKLLPYAVGALLILICLISVMTSLKIYSRKEL